jgi:branched-chain amino acid transport system permease protein
MPERPALGAPIPAASRGRSFLAVWSVVIAASGIAILALGRYGANLVAFGLLYAALATSWNWMRATGLFSLGHAAFFGVGALTQAWLVVRGGASPGPALFASAGAGALAAVPLIPALRLGPAAFGLATLAYAGLARSVAGNVRAFGTEGFLLPRTPSFEGPAPALLATLLAVALAATLGYRTFLRRPAGRAAAAIRQQPDAAQRYLPCRLFKTGSSVRS